MKLTPLVTVHHASVRVITEYGGVYFENNETDYSCIKEGKTTAAIGAAKKILKDFANENSREIQQLEDQLEDLKRIRHGIYQHADFLLTQNDF